ncbi:M48 family metallopeptidase [Fluviicola sp.]|uniref:M48 family metallopeptidase n=1 Tax=Fluviicola sp. TaxID=1917219 RepID=UPI003D2BDC63
MNQLHSIPKSIRISLLIILTSFFSFAQRDLNNYQTLLSKGDMPEDFSTPVSQKIANDLVSNKLTFKTKTEAQKYLKAIHERLDNMLFSGSVIYGDEISAYVQQVAANLLKDEPELLKELRFYTIKSNETNAFSTSPGIIFVTTGLITQLSSEAQLAFVLSHEIAHYEKKHVHEEYLNSQKVGEIKKREQILKLSQFSKEKELEADQLALKRYHKMGYSKDELLGTFDVLMYSYLPFDELSFPKDYFNTTNMYIPEESFNYAIKPITAEEDYKDTYSSHPNIKKRKDAIQKSVSEYTNWGEASFKLEENLFFELRTVCRLESIRLDIIDGNGFSALYSIFLMEKEFPSSFYLDKMKALGWLSLQQLKFKLERRSEDHKIEGESSLLYTFLDKSSVFEAATIGMRVIYDLRTKHAGDAFFEDTYKNYLDGFVMHQNVSLTAYQPFTYQQASLKAINKVNDTINKKETSNLSEGSKYSRIKEKRAIAQPAPAFDSTEFATYAIPDIIQDSSFIKEFKAIKAHKDSLKDASDLFYSLSKREQDKLWKLHIASLSKEAASFKKILIIEPYISLSTKNGVADWEMKSAEKSQQKTLLTNAQKQGFEPFILTQDSIIKGTTEDFNEYITYLSYWEQINNANNGENCLSIDYEALNKYTESRGTSQLLFTLIDYSYFPEFEAIPIIFGTIVAPFIPWVYFVYIPRTIKEGKHLNLYSMLINSKNGETFSYVLNDLHKSGVVENYSPYYSDFFKLIKQF